MRRDARLPGVGGDASTTCSRPSPVGRHRVYVCTNISCSLRGADELLDGLPRGRRRATSEFNVRALRVPRRLRHRADGLRRRRLLRPARRSRTCRAARRRARRARRCCPRSSSRAGWSPTRAPTHSEFRDATPADGRRGDADDRRDARASDPAVRRHRRARAEHARGLRAPRRLRGAAQGARDGARGGARASSKPRACAAAAAPASRWARRSRSCRKGAMDKYLVCNADESEPGTFKDRELMQKSPHMLIEGIVIASYAAGASRSFIYIRGEYDAAGRHARRRARAKPARRATSARTSSAPSTRSRWSCTAAPAPTSAARRRRCSTRWRASAATRA